MQLSLQMITPIRGRKLQVLPSPSGVLLLPFTDDNPDKGTETDSIYYSIIGYIWFTDDNPDKGTETLILFLSL